MRRRLAPVYRAAPSKVYTWLCGLSPHPPTSTDEVVLLLGVISPPFWVWSDWVGVGQGGAWRQAPPPQSWGGNPCVHPTNYTRSFGQTPKWAGLVPAPCLKGGVAEWTGVSAGFCSKGELNSEIRCTQVLVTKMGHVGIVEKVYIYIYCIQQTSSDLVYIVCVYAIT